MNLEFENLFAKFKKVYKIYFPSAILIRINLPIEHLFFMNLQPDNLFPLFRSPPSTRKAVCTPQTKESYEKTPFGLQNQSHPEVQQFGLDSELHLISKMIKSTSLEEKENEKHKTDRFIPIRKALSMEMDIQFQDQNTESLRGKQVNQSKITLDQMYKTLFLNKTQEKIFHFADSALKGNNIFNMFENNQNLAVSSGKKILQNCNIQKKYLNQEHRKITKTPFKVLDAPNLQDDFYLNLLEWSSQNILSVALDSSLYFWNANNNKVLRFLDLNPHSISSINWNDPGTQIAIGTSQGTTEIWDTNKCQKIYEVGGHQQRVSSLAWRTNMLASGSRDKTINLRDLRLNQRSIIQKYEGHTQQVCGLKWSFDGNQLASGGNDNKLITWSSASSVPINKFTQHSAAVKALAWSPHTHGVLASGGGSADRTIKFWNTLDGTMLDSIDTGSQVCNLMFSKTTKELVSTHGYSNNQIIVWKYPSLQKVTTLTGHTSRVLFLAMNPSGHTIVTGAGDETLRFWNVFPETKSQAPSKKSAFLSTMQLR